MANVESGWIFPAMLIFRAGKPWAQSLAAHGVVPNPPARTSPDSLAMVGRQIAID
jgi:hypothetical protein